MTVTLFRTRIILAAALVAGAVQPSAAELIFTRQGFDALDAQFDRTRNFAKAGADDFAWGESYVMQGYLEMYQATGDRDYLRRLVRVGDAILPTRDDHRAAREGKRARPLWSIGNQYTVARLVLKDQRGRDAVGLRSIRYAFNNQTMATVGPGTEPGTFRLETANKWWQQYGPAQAVYDNLSLDPAAPRYFERVVNDASYVPSTTFRRADGQDKPSFLLVAEDLRSRKRGSDRLAPVGPVALVPGVVAYHGYTGPILSGMARFGALVFQRPELQKEFGGTARRYLEAAQESISAYEGCWRRGPGPDQGYYLLIEKGADFWCDGVMAPFNYMASTGEVLLSLWDWRKDARVLDKLRRMAALFKQDCTLMPNGAYVFHYWSPLAMQGWRKPARWSVNTPEYLGPPAVEDLSHGAWSVEFAYMCYERGIVFTREDMQRFARTFLRNLWQPGGKTLALRVDGSSGSDGDVIAGTRWLDLCAVEPRIFEAERALYEAGGHDKAVYGHALGGYARMFHRQEALAGRAAVPMAP